MSMERIVSKGILQVSDKTETDAIELEGIDPASYKNLEVFKGIAASEAVTLNLFKHSPRALQQLGDAYSYGKGVYTDHFIKFSNRIGKTLKGTVTDGVLDVIFGIRPNLEVSHSNDIISIVRDTGADLSASYYPESISCGVEGCGKPMHAYGLWFFSWYECDEGHCVGDLYETDSGEKSRVIGIIDSIEDVVELSIVSAGANLETEVTDAFRQEVMDKVGTDMTFFRFLTESNGLNFDAACLKFGVEGGRSASTPPASTGHSEPPAQEPVGTGSAPNGGGQMNTEPKIIKDFTNLDWSAIENSDTEDLLEIIKEFADHVEKQVEIMKEMRSVSDYEALVSQRDELQQALTAAKTEVAVSAEKVRKYDAEVERLQDLCIERKQALRSYSDNDPRFIKYIADIRNEHDIHKLRAKSVGHSDTLEAVQSVRTYMELNQTAEPPVQVKSNY